MNHVIEIYAKRVLSMLLLFWLSLWLGCGGGQPQSETQGSSKRKESDTMKGVVAQSKTIERMTTNKAQQPTKLQPTELSMDQDTEIIKVVKDWYSSKKATIPHEITVSERNSNGWTVVASPGLPTEMWFRVDPKSKVILRAVGE